VQKRRSTDKQLRWQDYDYASVFGRLPAVPDLAFGFISVLCEGVFDSVVKLFSLLYYDARGLPRGKPYHHIYRRALSNRARQEAVQLLPSLWNHSCVSAVCVRRMSLKPTGLKSVQIGRGQVMCRAARGRASKELK